MKEENQINKRLAIIVWLILILSVILIAIYEKPAPEQEKGYVEELSDTEFESIEIGNNHDTN